MIGASMAVRPPRSRGPVLMMIDALRRIGGSLWMVDNAFSGAFVDNVGTTPVTAVADLIGLITDKSYGGQLGPNLVTNGDFSSGTTGWTVPAGWALSSGAMVATSESSSLLQQGAVSTVGRSYEVEFDWTHTGGTLYVRVGAGTAATFTSSGRKRVILVAASAAGVEFYGGTVSGTLDNITSKEVPGNHATQSAVASKPSVQRVPKRTRGPVNQLRWSGDFSNAAWQKSLLTIGAATTDPLGGTAAVTAAVASGGSLRQNSIAWAEGTVGTVAYWVRKSASGGANAVRLTTNNTAAWGTGISQKFALTSEWQLAVLSGALTSTGTTLSVMVGAMDSGASSDADCAGNVDIYRAALYKGAVTAQQIIDNGGIPLTTTTALPNVLEWANVIQFDGSNDFLQTGITTGEQGFLVAAVTPANTNTDMTVVNAGEGTSTIPGVWLFASGAGSWTSSAANGTVRAQASRVMTGAVPQVVSMCWSASNVSVGVDGAETSAARTGNCASGANVLCIGLYQGSSVPFNGPMHAIAYAPVLPDAATRKIIRDGIAALQGRTL